jgi:hypothetical protein
MDAVITLKHDLEMTLLVLQRAILVFIEITVTDKFLFKIEFDRDILSAEDSFGLIHLSLS